jgi:hypothetical protein
MVITHAVRISSATPQRTFPNLSDDPTPIMEELTTWVVLAGKPVKEANKTINAEDS